MKYIFKARKLHRRRTIHGMKISVENQAGSVRRWYDPHGKESGSMRMKYDYGYIRGTEGTDGDHVDVYVGPNPLSEKVYVVTQMKKPDFREVDEQKVMLGFNSAAAAKRAYLAHYNDDRFFGHMTKMSIAKFKQKVLDKGNHGELIRSVPAAPLTRETFIDGARRAGFLQKSGPYLGPRGGLWADPQHTVPWKDAEPGTREHTRAAVKHIEQKHGVELSVQHGDHLVLSKIVVPKDKRSSGIGSKAMADLHSYADAHGKTIALTPSSDFGGNKKRLREFYKRHGYVENKGRAKDYAISETMYREPKKKEQGRDSIEVKSISAADMSGSTKKWMEKKGYKRQLLFKLDGDIGLVAYEADDRFVAGNSEIPEGRRGQGLGVALYERLMQEASKKHLFVESDETVETPAAHVYEALERRGYELRKHPKATYVKPDPDDPEDHGYWFVNDHSGDGPFRIYPKKQESDAQSDPDHFAEVTEHGAHFKTGKPVDVKYTHRKQKTANFGSQYGQDIEPAGKYISHGHFGQPGTHTEAGGHKVTVEHGTVHFKKPLVIQHRGTGSEPGMWKRRLSDAYGGKKGKALSRAIAKDGYDGIVTVDGKYGTSEIVDLTQLHKSLTLSDLAKATRPPGAGWQPIPSGKRGGFRRRHGKGWEYWYPDAYGGEVHAQHGGGQDWKKPTEFTEAEFRSGMFDKDPTHWHWKKTDGDLKSWITGGIDPESKHPVKVGGRFAKLFQIEKPEDPKNPGFAVLRAVDTGERMLMQHNRIYPVEHSPLKRARIKKEEGPKWTPGDMGKPPKVTGTSSEGKHAPVFTGSTASPDTKPGTYAIENGAYLMKSTERWEVGSDGKKRRTRREVIAVTDHGKNLLVKEFEPLIMSTAKKIAKQYGLKMQHTRGLRGNVNETLTELQRSGIEGLLSAIEHYDAQGPFAAVARQFIGDYVRMGAARERLGGVTLPAKHARNLSRYIAARAQASKELGVENPSPEQVLPFFKLKKRHVHSNLRTDQGNQEVPMHGYKLVSVREGSPVVRRKTGETIGGDDTVERDTVSHPGKLEWATLYHSFLNGQQGAAEMMGEDTFALPGLSMGLGYTPEERVAIRQAVQRSLDTLSDFEMTTEGRKKTTYHGDAGEMLALKLGLYGDDEMSVREIAQRVPVYVTRKGERVQLGARQAETVVAEMIEKAVQHAREYVVDRDAKRLMERAADKLAPPAPVPNGPTWTEVVRERAKKVTDGQVAAYREGERSRLRVLAERAQERARLAKGPDKVVHENAAHAASEALRRVDRMTEAEIRMKLAQRLSPATEEMRRLMTQTVTVDLPAPRGFAYGHLDMTLTDLASGAQRRVRVRTLRDLRDEEDRLFEKSERQRADATLTSGMLTEALNYPQTMRLLVAPNEQIAVAPTSARRVVELLSGLGD